MNSFKHGDITTFFKICLAATCFVTGRTQGQALLSDYRLDPAGPHAVSLGYGLAANLNLTLTNQGGAVADWKLVFENSGPSDLAGTLESLDEGSAGVLSVIPDRYLFTDGITGSYINDGGSDMYDGGNYLKAGGITLNYSNGVVTSAAAGAGSVSYFTRKYDGLFVFAADFASVDDFAITGNLGADGGGQASADEFTIQKGGVSYRAFVHRVYGAGDPSINHLILVPSKPGLNHTYLTDTNNENDRVSGLGASSRVYYLLFAKSSGGLYPTQTFMDLADAFLDTVKGGPGWAFGNPDEGTVAAGQSGPVKLSLDAIGLEPGSYSTRFAVVPKTMAQADIPTGTLRNLTLTVGASTFTIPGGDLSFSTLAGISPDPVNVTLAPKVSGTVLSGLQTSSSASWVVPTVGADPNTIKLTFNTFGLPAGTSRATIEVWNGDTRQSFEVSVVSAPLNIVRFLPDPARPRLYAINGNGQNTGSLLVIDTLNRSVIRNIPLGNKPTDCDIGDNGQTLFAINSVDKTINAIDLSTLQKTATYSLPAYTDWGATTTHAHVRAGKGNILYYVDGQWGPRLRVFNRATGQVLQTFGASATGTNNDDGIGGLAVSPDGNSIFTWKQYGWSASTGNTYISRFSVNADGTLKFEEKTASAGSTNYPLDTPTLITADGSRLIVKDRAFLTSDLGEVSVICQDAIYSISSGAEIIAGTNAIYSGRNGEVLYNLPASSNVQTILPDFSSMVYFNATTGAVVWLDLASTLGTEALGLDIQPGDGATVAQPDQLRWYPSTGIYRYQVYLGTNRTAVETATTSSTTYLGETANPWLDLTTPLVAGSTYYWRVVPVGADGQPAGSGITRTFFVSNLTLTRSSITAQTVEGVARHVETIGITAPTPQAWSVTANVPWIGFESTNGTTPGTLVARFNATSLAPGYHDGAITLTSGGVSFDIPVSLRVYPANFMISEADLELPYVYAISQESNSSANPSFLLRINTQTDVIESAIPCGYSVTDLTIHYQENRIYLTNWKTGVLRAFDRTTFSQVQTYQFSPAGAVGYSEDDIWEVSAGAHGRLVVEEYDQWIDMSLINTADGSTVSTGFAREGGGLFDPSGRYYYHGENNSSGASLRKYDMGAGTFAELKSVRVDSFSYSGSRKVVMSGDGNRIFWNGGVFDRDLGILLRFSQQIIASTFHSDLLFTSTKAYNGVNGLELATLPVSANVMSVTGNQQKLYLFPANTKNFRVVNLSTIAALPPREITPTIADGSTVIGTDQSLGWSIEPFASSYRVYFGTDRNAVLNATETSPQYLGSSTTNAWTGTLPALSLNGEYYWRVDVVGFSGIRKGAVWSFNIAPILVTPKSMDLAFPTNSPIPRQQLSLTQPSSMTWTASTTTPWIRLVGTSGSTPTNFGFDLNSTGLAVGLHQGGITFQSAGDTFTVPVSLRIISLNVTKLVPHPVRPVVYGINTSAAGEGFCHLLEIDASTARIARSLPIGFGPTDASLDATNERLYISNWGYSQTRVIDLANWRELPPLALGDDVYKLNVTADGRVITEGEDQWVYLNMWNAATGSKLANAYSVSEGDGEIDQARNFYYHCDNNSSGARITKFNISGNSFVSAITGPQISYGSRNLILSGDGSRLFWLARVLDSDLRVLSLMPGEVYATNRSGELAFGAGAVWWTDSGTAITTLPFQSTVAAVSSNDSHVIRFNATTRTLHSTALSNIADLPGPNPRPGQVLAQSPDRLSWSPVAGATSYRVFIAESAAALAAMTSPVATVTTTYYDIPSPLDFGRFYSWRVDAVTSSGVTTGAVQSFGIRFPDGPALASMGSSNSTGIATSISNRHLLVGIEGSARLYQFDPATGASSPEQNFTIPGYYWNHEFGNAVALDAGKASIGAYSYDTPVSDGGAAFVFRQGASGYWESSGALTPPSPVANEAFGSGLAASGNMMLAGTGGAYGVRGRVTAYLTEPSVVPMQTFSASDGVAYDGFGQVIAMDGNAAIVSAPGRGSSYNRLACLYAFSRSTTTGLWTQTQKIAIPGKISSDNNGNALALSGNYMATNYNSGDASVVIYQKNSSGQWIQSAIISRSSIAGSSSYSFGKALAISGDLLFVGDTGASYGGTSGGAVYSFRRSGTSWIPGPVISPGSGSYSNFGQALAVHDGWLLAASGGSSQPAWLFRVDAAANHTPAFRENLPTQVVAGRSFSTDIFAEDAEGNDGLLFDLLQGPPWMSLANAGNGRAVLSGTPVGNSGDVHTVQIRVRDNAGAQALRTYQLTLLSPTDLPRLTLEPASGEPGEGQEVILRAAAEGIGPFQWQWYRDGEPIPGANRAKLVFAEISLADSRDYSVRVSNVVGEDVSGVATLSVHPANRFAGDWETFGNSPRHTGYHPARLGRHIFVPAWSTTIAAGRALNRAATGDGLVFTTPNVYFGGSYSAMAVNLKTGAPVWSHPFASAYSINPPTYHNGRVYIQRGNHSSDTQLWSLDAGTGATVWSSPHSAQWEDYEAPTVTDDGIWVNGGSYGGMYGFAPNGTQTFFQDLPQVDGWTPTVSDGRLFTCVSGVFQEHNPTNGINLWSLNSVSGSGTFPIAGDSAVILSGSELVCVDLPSRSIRWRKSGVFYGTAAISGNRVYAIGTNRNTVASFSLADGAPGPVATVPETITSGQPLLLMDRIAVAGSSRTYVINPSTSAVVNTFTGGGLLSYTNGYLLAAGPDGTLRAWYANGAPEFTANVPKSINAGDAAPDYQLNLASYVEDVDPGETLRWEIASVSGPSIFRSFKIDATTGILSVVYHPWAAGTSLATIAVIDSLGQRTETTIAFTLPPHPLPEVTVTSTPALSRLTGLYEQQITVKNIAARAIAGFDLFISGLRTGVSLYNGSSSGEGGGTVSHHQPMEAGESVSLVLEYYAAPRGTVPTPVMTTAVTLPDSEKLNALSAAVPAFAVNRLVKQADGSVVIEFNAVPGKHYRIQYSEDAANWKSCPVSIQAGGTKVQWIDRGPPWTDSPPSSIPRRFYRVQRVDN